MADGWAKAESRNSRRPGGKERVEGRGENGRPDHRTTETLNLELRTLNLGMGKQGGGGATGGAVPVPLYQANRHRGFMRLYLYQNPYQDRSGPVPKTAEGRGERGEMAARTTGLRTHHLHSAFFSVHFAILGFANVRSKKRITLKKVRFCQVFALRKK